MLVKIIAISSQKTTPSERLLRGGLCLLALAIAVKPLAQAVGYHLRYATATTAASGGNREELLEPRPAGCECRPRHEADAGSRKTDISNESAGDSRIAHVHSRVVELDRGCDPSDR